MLIRTSLGRFLITLAALLLAGCRPLGSGPDALPPASVSPAPSFADETPNPQSPSDVLKVAAVGDIGDGSQSAASVAKAIARIHRSERIDLLLLLGDLIYPSGNPSEYEVKFEAIYRPVIDAGIQTRAILGNHDLETDASGMLEAFQIPDRNYFFDLGQTRFVGLDTSRGSIDSSQQRWLELALDSGKRWKVVFTHVPSYSSGIHGSSPGLQRFLDGIFDRFDVNLLLAGHDHNYERTKPIHGVVHVISGGGCCPRPVGRSAFTEMSAGVLHFLVLEITQSQIVIRAVDIDGGTFDRSVVLPVARSPAA